MISGIGRDLVGYRCGVKERVGEETQLNAVVRESKRLRPCVDAGSASRSVTALGRSAHLPGVTVSIRGMTAGDGDRYLLNSVVTGDGDRDAASALTRHYAEAGTPPGSWVGSGLTGLPDPLLHGSEVSEEQLRRLVGYGQDPVTGEQLGRPYRRFATAAERVERRLENLPEGLSPDNSGRRISVDEGGGDREADGCFCGWVRPHFLGSEVGLDSVGGCRWRDAGPHRGCASCGDPRRDRTAGAGRRDDARRG